MSQGAARQAIWIGGLLVVLALAAQLLLPPAAAAFLTRVLRDEVGAEGQVRVRVESVPAVELLVGQVDRLQVDAQQVRLGELAVETLLLDVRGLQVDLLRTFRGEFAARRPGTARARLVLTEEALNEYLWTHLDTSQLFRIHISPSVVTLEGSLFGEVLPVRVEGELLVADAAHLRFQPRRVSVREAQLPEAILRVVGQELLFPVGVEDLPLPIGLDGLTLADGWLVATGSSEALTEGAPGR
ncbi:MAG: DUF2993 domain-containing protein [Firmicutes bacterium]|nr:hypothetical protein [Bacillota bacterium]MBO2519411.1 hypothetical protein [Bacillota bacterium]NMA71114.1 DUF2993 domain-containing protein [Bacillota bacterium]